MCFFVLLYLCSHVIERKINQQVSFSFISVHGTVGYGLQADELGQELFAHLLSLAVVLGRRLRYDKRIKLCN